VGMGGWRRIQDAAAQGALSLIPGMLTTNSLFGDYNSIHSGNSAAADQRGPGSFSNLKYVLTNWMMPCVSLLPSLIYSMLNYSPFRATQ